MSVEKTKTVQTEGVYSLVGHSQNGYQDESTGQAYNAKSISGKKNKSWEPDVLYGKTL